MNIVLYVIATALLWVPTIWLYPKKHRLVRLSHLLDNDVRWQRVFRRHLVINLARAWLGVAVCFDGSPMRYGQFSWLALILVVGVCLQLWRGGKAVNLLKPAPVAYLFGITLGLMPLMCALVVVVLAVTLALSFRSIRLFFLVGAIASPVLGYFLGARGINASLVCLLYLLPWLLSTSRGKSLGLCMPIRNLPKTHISSPMRKMPFMDSRPPFRLESLPESPTAELDFPRVERQ